MFSFLKKKKNKEGQPVDEETGKDGKQSAKSEVNLDNISFHKMPEKFSHASGSKSRNPKLLGFIIIGGGTVAIIIASIFLVRYIFIQSEKEPLPVAVDQQEEQQSEDNKTEDPSSAKASADAKAMADKTEDEEKGVVECGTITNIDSSSDSVLNCMGEQIADNCKQATAVVETDNFGEVEYIVQGDQYGSCLIRLNYPRSFQILDNDLMSYANSYVQCAYDINNSSELPTKPVALAQHLFKESSVDNLTDETVCVGSAVDVRQALAQTELEDEPGEEIVTQAGVDTDDDNLTDIEEQVVFGTDSTSKDTDRDGYEDATEVFNLYNPAGSGVLNESGLVKEYQGSIYSVLYPSKWQLQEGEESAQFLSSDNNFIQILTQNNSRKLNIKSWYANLTNVNTSEVNQAVKTTKNEFEFIFSEDGLTAYVTESGGGSNVYIISYSPKQGGRIEFLSTLQMVINSLSSL